MNETKKPRDNRMNYTLAAVLAAGIVALTLYVSSISADVVRQTSLMICGAVIGLVISFIVNVILKVEPKRLLLTLLMAVPTIVAVVFIVLYYRKTDGFIVPDLIESNVIADFRGSKGSVARTAYGLPFSMMSDSSFNMSSKVWYERAQGGINDGGFLRVHYQIEPMEGREGYVGIYADFSPPPAEPVSLLEYNGISFRMRISQQGGKFPEIRVVLYSNNIRNLEYAYPIARVQHDEQWRDYDIPFSKFESPPLNNVQLDPCCVFRFAFVLISDLEIHGHLDIDEIKLFQ